MKAERMCVIVSCLLTLCQSGENVRLERWSAISVDKLTLSDARAMAGRRLGALFRPRRWSMASSWLTIDSFHSFGADWTDANEDVQTRRLMTSWTFPTPPVTMLQRPSRQLVVPEISAESQHSVNGRAGGGDVRFHGPVADRSLS
jgi:hypothetical protein